MRVFLIIRGYVLFIYRLYLYQFIVRVKFELELSQPIRTDRRTLFPDTVIQIIYPDKTQHRRLQYYVICRVRKLIIIKYIFFSGLFIGTTHVIF